MKRQKFCWSELPPELLLSIAKRLETRLDIFHFRVVCKDWCRSVSPVIQSHKNMLSPFLPHKLTPRLKGGSHSRLQLFYDRITVNHLILTASSIFCVKPIDENLPPWLITVDEVNQGKLCLRIPFCRSSVKKMPGNFKSNLGLGKFDVVEMGRVYSLRFDEKCYDFVFEGFEKFNNLFEEDHKVVLLGETRSKIDDYIAVVLYDNGTLAVIRLRDGKVDVVSGDSSGRKFDDIVVFNGVVYAIDRRGRLYLMDKGSNGDRFRLLSLMKDALKSGGERKSRLVESLGELCLVRKCPLSSYGKPSYNFLVYKLNQEKNTWEEINSIGNDRILFVTPDCCFFASVADFCGWKGNCIVTHTRNSFPLNARPYSEYNESYSNYILERDGEKLSVEVFHFEGSKTCAVEDFPKYSDVFWPPPQWISPNTCFPKVKFQGLYIRVELIPTLETIWDKHGSLIGSDIVLRNKILASALEELAELVINLKYITAKTTLTNSQADALRSKLLDFQHKGLKVDWLRSIIDKAVMFHKNETIIESVKGLDKAIAKLHEKKRDFLAESAKLKEELKEHIDLDDYFGKVLW